MIYSDKIDIQNLPLSFKSNLINSLTGLKPANLVGTVSQQGNSNLAMISSVVHLSSDPPVIGFFTRNRTNNPGDTLINIMESQHYTISHVGKDFVNEAHHTSQKFDRCISEFEVCGLTEYYIEGFNAPFVRESGIGLGLEWKENVQVKTSGTVMIVGSIQHIFVNPSWIGTDGAIDLQDASSLGVAGRNTYYSCIKIADFKNHIPQHQ